MLIFNDRDMLFDCFQTRQNRNSDVLKLNISKEFASAMNFFEILNKFGVSSFPLAVIIVGNALLNMKQFFLNSRLCGRFI
jgi:hypothetical protein